MSVATQSFSATGMLHQAQAVLDAASKVESARLGAAAWAYMPRGQANLPAQAGRLARTAPQ